MCERECVYRERDGERERSGCVFSLFLLCLWKLSPAYPFCPLNFWSQANLGLNFSLGTSFIYLSIHSPNCTERLLDFIILCLIFLPYETETDRAVMITQ